MYSTRSREIYTRFVIALGAITLFLCLARTDFTQLDLKFLLLAAVTVFFSARVEVPIPHSSGLPMPEPKSACRSWTSSGATATAS